jgi:hypothetical protein
MLALVFLPEQIERDPFAPQFAMYHRPVGFGPGRVRWGCRRVQLRFQRYFAHPRRQRVGDPALLGPPQNLTHRGRRRADYPGDLAMAAATLLA